MILSTLVRPFKSFFESGTAFSEKIVPHALQKIGIPQSTAAKIGLAIGCVAGLASVATGACFLAGIPLSVPMFLLSPAYFGLKGVVTAIAAAGLLGGVGTVVTTTGLGMCRSAVRSCVKLAAPPTPEKSGFDGSKTARTAFHQAQTAPVLSASKPASPAPKQLSARF